MFRTEIGKILKDEYTDGGKMKAVENIISKKLKSNLAVEINKEFTDLVFPSLRGEHGFVIFAKVMGTSEVAIKTVTNNTQNEDEDLEREYTLCKKGINALRNEVPNYMFAFGMFTCPRLVPPTAQVCEGTGKILPFVVLEKVKGSTLNKYMTAMNMRGFIYIYVQILIALEYGQRKCRFGHNDLHGDNVMIYEHNPSYKYTVNFDTKTYTINTKYIPVFIDYGFTTITTIKGEVIGTDDYSSVNRSRLLIPAFDMCWILISCFNQARKSLKKKMLHLFEFFGINDPYEILKDPLTNIQDAIVEYGSRIPDSNIASCTPLEFLNWIIASGKYDVSGVLDITPRVDCICYPISLFSTGVVENEIMGTKTPLKLNFKIESYITGLYLKAMFQKYGDVYLDYIQQIDSILSKNEADLKAFDDKVINTVIKPFDKILDDNCPILFSTKYKKVLIQQTNLMPIIPMVNELKRMIHFSYMINELGLDKTKYQPLFDTLSLYQKSFEDREVLFSKMVRWITTRIQYEQLYKFQLTQNIFNEDIEAY